MSNAGCVQTFGGLFTFTVCTFPGHTLVRILYIVMDNISKRERKKKKTERTAICAALSYKPGLRGAGLFKSVSKLTLQRQLTL